MPALAPPPEARFGFGASDKFYIATLTFLRARQLKAGARPLVAGRGHRPVRVALLEVLSGLVWSVEEAEGGPAPPLPLTARASSIALVGGFVVRLRFTDGTECTVDLEPCLRGHGREALKRDPRLFAAVALDAEGALVWPNVERLSLEALCEQAPSAFLRSSRPPEGYSAGPVRGPSTPMREAPAPVAASMASTTRP